MAERSVTVRIAATDSFSSVVDTYKRKMGEAETSTRNMGTASDASKSNMDKLTGAVKGFVAGIALQEVVNFGVEMTNLGRDVNLTKQRFEELAGPMGNVDTIIQNLRNASLGTASDQTLMEGSNLLMMTGVASSPAELEQIISLITRTKKPTEDLGDAINNFSLMLTNQSLLRLDSFGLSSGRVRARILELLETGQALNREDAFRLAVLEDGAKLLDRLGDSATAAATPLARLETSLENFKNTAASNIATGVEGSLGLLELALGQHPEQQRQAQEAANLFAADFQTALASAMADPAMAGSDQSFVSDFMSRAIKLAQNDPALAQDAIALRNAVLGEFGVFDPEAALAGGLSDMSGQINSMAQIAQYTVANNALARETLTVQTQQADELSRQEDAAKRVNQLYSDINTTIQNGMSLWETMSQNAMQAVGLREQLLGGLGFIDEQAQGIGVSRFMSEEDAEAMARLAEEAEATVKQMEELDKINDQMFSETEIEFARGLAEEIGVMADESERAAEALKNIKLSDIFGQGGGGVTGEIGDLLIAQMRAGGASDEQIAAAQRELDLTSGRETTGSLALKENLVPQIAALTDDPELMAEMAAAIGKVLTGAAQMGLDTNNPEFLGQLGTELEGEGAAFDPESFLTNFEDMSTQSEALSTNITAFLDSMLNAEEPVGAVDVLMGSISTYAATIRTDIEALTSKVQQVKVKVKVEYDDPQGWLSGQVRAAGGSVPGADPRAGQGPQ